jgi:predicted RNase H-like nuclease
VKFIGIDLGWRSGESGLCCLQADGDRLELLDVTRRLSLEDIFAWLDQWVEPTWGAMVAVDAPTLIPNPTGTRLPDRLTHQYFGKYHAGCYPANLGRPFAERTIAVGLGLEERGFVHAPTITPQGPGRYQIEVFPHPAMVRLFHLERIIKYKKGTLAAKKTALAYLQTCLQSHLSQLTPTLGITAPLIQPLWRSPLDLKGKDLKALEDQLDSLMCAYIGAYWWYWGLERNQVLGDRRSGYIIVPQERL